MPIMMPRRHFITTAVAASVAAPTVLRASDATPHQISMLNRHPEAGNMVFYPQIIAAQAGDRVQFVAEARGHNTQSVDGMLPIAVEGWRGRINEEVEIALDAPGFYGFICQPHAAMGMAGIIVVEGDGKMDNYEAAKAVEPRQRRLGQKFAELFEQIEADGLATA